MHIEDIINCTLSTKTDVTHPLNSVHYNDITCCLCQKVIITDY